MIIAGFGFRSTATLESLLDAYQQAGAPQITAIATSEDKNASNVFMRLSEQLNVPRLGITRIELEAMETLTQSTASKKHRGLGSLAEAAAMGAIGLGAKLRAPRFISHDRMATCAIAQGDDI